MELSEKKDLWNSSYARVRHAVQNKRGGAEESGKPTGAFWISLRESSLANFFPSAERHQSAAGPSNSLKGKGPCRSESRKKVRRKDCATRSSTLSSRRKPLRLGWKKGTTDICSQRERTAAKARKKMYKTKSVLGKNTTENRSPLGFIGSVGCTTTGLTLGKRAGPGLLRKNLSTRKAKKKQRDIILGRNVRPKTSISKGLVTQQLGNGVTVKKGLLPQGMGRP